MGQANKKKARQCPALNRSITPTECGEARISRIPCTASCPHNPWAPTAYDHASMIEDETYKKLAYRLHRDRPEVEFMLPPHDLIKRQAALTEAYFHTRDTQGLTLMQRWESDRWQGLNNDQLVFLKALSRQKVALIEILEVLNDEETRVRDRLIPDSAPFIIHDRAQARQAARFMTLASMIVEMPHYVRVNGAAIGIPQLGGFEAVDIIRAISAHQGGPSEAEALRGWLGAHWGLFGECSSAIHGAVTDSMTQGSEFTRIEFRLTVPSNQFTAKMNACADVISQPVSKEDQDTMTHEWAWKAPTDRPDPDKVPVLGRVLHGGDVVRLHAGGRNRIASLRSAFEALAGSMVAFHSQRVDDIGAQYRARKGQPTNMALVPPALLNAMPKLDTTVYLISNELFSKTGGNAKAVLDANRDWCDMAIPALAGKTPRAAATDPSLRPRLVNMVKQMITLDDLRGLQGNLMSDDTRIARELGLTEIIFPTPPQLIPRLKSATDERD